MSIKDHINRVPKMRARITTVDTTNLYVECVAKDGQVRRINVQEQLPTLFRWPTEGEEWMIAEQNGSWYLGDRVNTTLDYPLINQEQLSQGDYSVEMSAEQQIVTMDIPGVTSDQRIRHTVARKYTGLIGDGTSTFLFVIHALHTPAVVCSLTDVTTGEPISLDVIRQIADDFIWLDFAVAPALNSIRATVIG